MTGDTDPFVRALTGSPDSRALAFERVYRGSPDELWSALTEPARVARWLGTIEGAPAAVGDPFVLNCGPDPSDSGTCRVAECDRPQRLACVWHWHGEPESYVAVTLELVPAGTLLRLHHSRLPGEFVPMYGGGWEDLLLVLDAQLGGSPPDPAHEAKAAAAWRQLAAYPLEIERTFPAAPEAVWDAFTTVDGLRGWWWNHWSDTEIAVDAREGGQYRFAAPGVGIAVEGEYLAVEPAELLSFTWRWIDADGESRSEAVDIRFEAVPEGTRLVMRHTGPWPDDSPAKSYREGWEFTLGALGRLLTAAV